MNVTMRELNERELMEVDGGIAFLAAVGVAAAVVGLFYVSEQAGEYIGKAVYYATH